MFQVMVGAYGGMGAPRAALLPAPAPAAGGKAVISRPPTRTNGSRESDPPPITVFIGKCSITKEEI